MAIDEVSKALGRLEASIETLLSSTAGIKAQQDKMDDKLTLINGRVGKAHDRIDVMLEPLKEAHENGRDWADTKRKAKWIIGGMGMTGAFSGFSITKAFAAWFQ